MPLSKPSNAAQSAKQPALLESPSFTAPQYPGWIQCSSKPFWLKHHFNICNHFDLNKVKRVMNPKFSGCALALIGMAAMNAPTQKYQNKRAKLDEAWPVLQNELTERQKAHCP
jgi:hypothetical protein